jgi:hypothetical protein
VFVKTKVKVTDNIEKALAYHVICPFSSHYKSVKFYDTNPRGQYQFWHSKLVFLSKPVKVTDINKDRIDYGVKKIYDTGPWV